MSDLWEPRRVLLTGGAGFQATTRLEEELRRAIFWYREKRAAAKRITR